ncbi:hypothetical protein AX774_g5813 [Zancudomyces culisetae]|uniref:Uncharacterized protein n=1 Tax=Zancudomyces culisetae TaxID=1213189 RepID=A0A1R1PIJ6_ZANCU|nr:hypothetical protein AX774_g5813 [Zancudomyces culisetae]|eukprot:OMH80749.1 hypothetical protein AX774_g5813 [Zancudomyces culisetae]
MYLDSHSRARFKGSPSPAAAAGAAGIEELFMQKLKASEAQWSDIKANKAGTASVSPSPLAFSPRASSANSSRPGSAAGGSSTGISKKKGFFFR